MAQVAAAAGPPRQLAPPLPRDDPLGKAPAGTGRPTLPPVKAPAATAPATASGSPGTPAKAPTPSPAPPALSTTNPPAAAAAAAPSTPTAKVASASGKASKGGSSLSRNQVVPSPGTQGGAAADGTANVTVKAEAKPAAGAGGATTAHLKQVHESMESMMEQIKAELAGLKAGGGATAGAGRGSSSGKKGEEAGGAPRGLPEAAPAAPETAPVEIECNTYNKVAVYFFNKGRAKDSAAAPPRLLNLVGKLVSLIFTVAMQVLLPVSLLRNWVSQDGSSDKSVWSEAFQLFSYSGPNSTSEGVIQFQNGTELSSSRASFTPSDADSAEMALWLLVTQIAVGTYCVLFCLKVDLLQDMLPLMKLMLDAMHVDPKLNSWRDLAAALLSIAVLWVHAGVTSLILLVTMIMITRSATVQDVILNGVGTLFILDADKLLVVRSKEFDDKIKRMDEMRKADERTKEAAAAAGAEQAGSCLHLMHFSVHALQIPHLLAGCGWCALYVALVYFLMRVHGHDVLHL